MQNTLKMYDLQIKIKQDNQQLKVLFGLLQKN